MTLSWRDLSYPRRESQIREDIARGTIYFVAEAPGGGLIGFATCGPERPENSGFAGAVARHTLSLTIGGTACKEIEYGWSDIAELLRRLGR